MSRRQSILVFIGVWITLFIGTIVWRSIGQAANLSGDHGSSSERNEYYTDLVKRVVQAKLDAQPMITAGKHGLGVDENVYPGFITAFGDVLQNRKEKLYACLNSALENSYHTEYVDLSFETSDSISSELVVGGGQRHPIRPVLERSSLQLDLTAKTCVEDTIGAASFRSVKAPPERVFYRFCINRRPHN